MNFAKPALLRQYHFYFALAFVATVISFWPSFFSKLPSTDAAHIVHGLTATLWMTMPILQSWLITRQKFDLHRKIGWGILLLLAPALVISGLHMVRLMIIRYHQIHQIRLLKFAFMDMAVLTLFILFLFIAIWRIRRNDMDGHARYMAATALLALEPALERVFVYHISGGSAAGFANALTFALICMEVILAVLIFVEWRRKRIRLPFPLVLAFFVAMHFVLTPIANSAWFARFADWFAKI